jgi:ketosteroid isomerase-like protein
MSQENVETVRRAVEAVNRRDLTGYLACCTEDVELRTPLMDIAGFYRGADGIRQFFADLEDSAPNFRLDVEGVEAVDADRVIAFLQTDASGRVSGVPLVIPTINVYELAGGRIRRIRVFSDREKAFEAVGMPE